MTLKESTAQRQRRRFRNPLTDFRAHVDHALRGGHIDGDEMREAASTMPRCSSRASGKDSLRTPAFWLSPSDLPSQVVRP
jgi:hypothetical protein